MQHSPWKLWDLESGEPTPHANEARLVLEGGLRGVRKCKCISCLVFRCDSLAMRNACFTHAVVLCGTSLQ